MRHSTVYLSLLFLNLCEKSISQKHGPLDAAARFRESGFDDELGLTNVNASDWLHECVPPYQAREFERSLTNWSNYYQMAMPSGLCADALSCAFERCEWSDEISEYLMTIDLNVATYRECASRLPPLNLPAKISFPNSVVELTQIVRYANRRSMGISVKTSGHSYVGSSTAKGSIQLNLRSFPKYSHKSTVLCDGTNEHMHAACKLAQARGKTAVIRVGGGELFDDLYRSILDWNTQTGRFIGREYEVLGGGAGTVSAAGGWLQGGGLSIGLERLHGFGVDQVLEIEMILADGSHVKFGPSEWQEVEGFTYPQTNKVEGMCNHNVDVDESRWEWAECESPIPFDDLWFAVRGGGGGTYGILTALQYQLHSQWDLEFVFVDETTLPAVLSIFSQWNSSTQTIFENMWYDFFIDLLFNPSVLGLSEDSSNACGQAGLQLSIFGTYAGTSFSGLWCKKGPAQEVVDAWQAFVTENVTQQIPDMSTASIKILENFLIIAADWVSYPQQMILQNDVDPRVPTGHVPDNPTVTTPADTAGMWSAAVPIEWLLQKNDDVHFFLKNIMTGAHLVGGKSAVAQDQFAAVPQHVRTAGFQCSIYEPFIDEYRALFRPFIQNQYNTSTYPPDTEYNHISPDVIGPLKTDWSSSCSSNFTKKEEGELCVSLQESVWGEKLLSKLSKIKAQVDPKHLFNCYQCVGYQDNKD